MFNGVFLSLAPAIFTIYITMVGRIATYPAISNPTGYRRFSGDWGNVRGSLLFSKLRESNTTDTKE